LNLPPFRAGNGPIILSAMKKLSEYRRKREFQRTPEPKGELGKNERNIFVVQRHAARRLHFDFRMEIDGVLKSWAVPKGPPTSPGEKRLAVHVEDHPLEYGNFEGEIPKGNYGAGEVSIWDRGHFTVEGPPDAAAQLARGDFKFYLEGSRLRGRYVLVKMKHAERGNEWLLICKQESAEERDSHPKVSSAANATGPGALPGAVAAPMPAQIRAALATLEEEPFSHPDWLFEIKWDGERALVWIRAGEIEIRSRSGRNITQEYPELKEIVKCLDAREAVLDGEIVVLDKTGRADFKRLQRRFGVQNPSAALRREAPAAYYTFDLLFCDGYDLRNVALINRKALLGQLLSANATVRFSDHQVEHGKELFEVARERGLEGIVAKRQNSPYAEGRSGLWIKFKIVHDLDVVIGGWTAPRKSRDHFGALLMGLYRGKELHYIGNVGTGFSQETLKQTHDLLRDLQTPHCPFAAPPKVAEAMKWVKPRLVARVHYADWTEDQRLRAPVFLGFRDDVPADSCTFEGEPPRREKPSSGASHPAPSSTVPLAAASNVDLEEELLRGRGETLSAELDGKKLVLTHLNKIFFPESGFRKRDLLGYYLRVSKYILPFLKDRPMVLKRYPNGINGKFFFQKEAMPHRPPWLETASIYSEERRGKMQYFVADDAATLLYLTNLGCIDHNPWSSRFADERHPDYVFFDLDPTEGTPFDVVCEVAHATHKHLTKLGVHSYLKTSGATGFHIYVPLEPKYSYEQARMFAEAIGQLVKVDLPKQVTFRRLVSARPKGTVLMDAAQNAHGKPLASVYSVRPFPGAPVSTPVSPEELRGLRPEAWNIATLPDRLKSRGDLWSDFWKHRQKLEDIVASAS
jgi:bifunctional non-homologous end joining protein LigD